MNFADRLQQLPSASHLAALQLLGANGQVLATIENKPGQTGSLVVYAALAALYGGSITPAARRLGLEGDVGQVGDARAFPRRRPAWGWSGMPSMWPMRGLSPASTPTSTGCWRGRRAPRATAPSPWPRDGQVAEVLFWLQGVEHAPVHSS